MRLMRSLPLCALASALLCGTAAMAQQFAPTVRIVDRVDESQVVTLKGNTHPAANAKNDLGRVSPGLPMTDLILVLSRSPEQQAAFEKFVASQYDSASPDFHQWLTPEQVGENFGPSQTDIATISNWLTGHGFSVDQVTKDRMSLRFSGTAGQVQSAFHTEIHNLSVRGVAHIGNMSDPQIPTALSTVVVGVKALHNFFPRPAHHMGSVVTRDAATGLWKRVSSPAATQSARSASASRPALGGVAIGSPLAAGARAAAARPQFGSNPSSEGFAWLVEDLGPYDFGTIYNVLPLWNAGIDGTGQKIAIAGTSDIDVGQTGETGANGNNDVAIFRSFFGLPTNLPANTPLRVSGNPNEQLTVCTDTTGTVPYPSNPCTTDDLIENSLDVEWSGSIAKNAQIVLVASYPASASDDNLYDSESYIVNNIDTASSPVFGARIMNVSYGECELGNGTAGNVEYYDLWQTAASEGISVFVAAGDSGSASCDDGYSWAASGLTVSGLASTPWNTAVGGTDFNWCSPDTANGSADTECKAAPYWSSSNLTPPGGAQGSYTALGYVPEVPWNESCANPLTLSWVQDSANYIYGIPSSGSNGITNVEQSCNFIDDYYGNFSGDLGETYPYLENLLAVVGGSGGSSGCVVGNAVTNTTTGETTGCTVGATNTGSTSNPDTGANQASLTVYPTATGSGWPKPSWQTGVSGIPGDGVRDLPDVSFFAADGYVSSSAYLICVSQEGACSYSSLTEPFAQEVGGTSVATPAMAGVMALIDQKVGSAQGLATPGLYALAAKQSQSGYASCSAESVKASSTSCYFNDVDEYNIAQPCDAYDSTPNCTATSSTFGYADNSAENGLGILTGYSAGAGYDLATGLGSLNVANVVNAWTAVKGAAAATVTVTPGSSSINSSNTLSVTVTVASTASGGATPTGTVTLTASGSTYSASAASSTGSYLFTIPANSLPGSATGESDTLTAGYAGDALYAATSNTAKVTVTTTTVAELMPTITVTPASATLNSGASLGVTVTVTGNGVIVPTGTVTLTSGSYTSGAQTLASSGSCTAAACSITIPANTLSGSSGGASDTITATYSGDGTYQSGSGTASVTVTESSFSLTQTPIAVSPATIAPGASSTATVTVTSVAGYVGSITLTCSLQSTTAASGGDGASCSGGSTPVTISSSGTVSGSPVVFTIGTTAPSTASLVYPKLPGKGWMGAGGGAVLALLVFFGIPARRRSWRQMLGVVMLLAALGCLSACGGGGSSGGGGGGGQTDPGTLAGTYTFQVQGTGTPSVTPAVSTTFTVTVN
jgi:subtilase family serine protease